MLWNLPLKCPSCEGEKFKYPVAPGPDELLVCSGCGRRSTYDELRELADTRFTLEVDMALARVRRVRERFPHRW